jgi:sugar O-acyltransferase (sialic acid O-acetyltransferase NeuD family)
MRLLIYGSMDFAKTAAELARHCGHEVAGMIDDFNSGPDILGTFNAVRLSHSPSDFSVVMAIGYSDIPARWKAWKKVSSSGYHAPALIHPSAYVADTARVGDGVMIMAGAIVDVHTEIGDLAVIWPGSCVNHDSKIGSNTFVSPNATVCGFANVGSNCFIGAGSVIADHCKVPQGSLIKMLSRYSG